MELTQCRIVIILSKKYIFSLNIYFCVTKNLFLKEDLELVSRFFVFIKTCEIVYNKNVYTMTQVLLSYQ